MHDILKHRKIHKSPKHGKKPMENSNIYANELKMLRLEISNIDDDYVTMSCGISSINDLLTTESEIAMHSSSYIFTTCGDDATSFPDALSFCDLIYAKNFLI